MKKFLLLLIIPFLSFGQVLTEKETKSYFTEVANETASMCPVKLDRYTTLTGCLYLHKSRTIMYSGIIDVEIYLYEDSGLSRKEIEEFTIKEWQEIWLMEQEKIQTNMFCSSPELKIFRDNNIIVNYSYINPSGLYVGNIQLQNGKNCK
tara:strand:- start:2432 stop:2878 length:447 start_codon:yes stop_codon:yes gene_type:complete